MLLCLGAAAATLLLALPAGANARASTGRLAWRVSLAGYGPLKFGMGAKAVDRAAPRGIDCTSVGDSAGCDCATVNGLRGVRLLFGGRARGLDIIEVGRRGVATDRGLAVGDSVAKLRRRYPRLHRISSFGFGNRPAWVYKLHGRALIFGLSAGGRRVGGIVAQRRYSREFECG